MQKHPDYQDIVLVGGGHAHAILLRMWAMNPLPGARLTLVSPQTHAAYSGMLPGLVAGHYELDDTHIDLVRLCRAAGARFIQACAHQIDPVTRRISLLGRPDLEYDLLSLDTGATPARELPGSELAIPVKPIGHFHRYWLQLKERVQHTRARVRIGVIGAGAGGCELAMAMAFALEEQVYSGRVEVHLVHAGRQIPHGYPSLTRKLVARELKRLQVRVHHNWPVTAITDAGVKGEGEQFLELDEVILSTNACAPPWLANAGLPLDSAGFVAVDDYLRSTGFANVFAAGDVASFSRQSLPKAGVYAVRQGPVLFQNLRATLTGEKLRRYRPQRNFLSLLSCGSQRAVGSRNHLAAAGDFIWRWKDHIDRTFMRRFSELPIGMDNSTASRWRRQPVLNERSGVTIQQMRCNGCGAKVGAEVLQRALRSLPPQQSPLLLRGTGDDAAVMKLPAGKLLVQSSDQLRAPVSDPWLFGRLTALHALSDLFAMHARPHSAQVLATLPVAAPEITARDLQLLLAGAVYELNRHDCTLSGGHTSEGAELQLGLTVNGFADSETLLAKTGAQAGDCLILTKPLGVGTILAAEAAGAAHARWYQHALDTMLRSNAEAAEILARHDARALTDVTGFGLLGHLLEMLGENGALGATLIASELPLVEGAAECVDGGWLSSLQPQNAKFYAQVANPDGWQPLPHWSLLSDPQTCGGLLAPIPAERAAHAVLALRDAGYLQATVIGVVREVAGEESLTPIQLLREGDWHTLSQPTKVEVPGQV